jgi:transposase InsO family protein
MAVRLVVEDGLPYRPASWHAWRDHRVFVPWATIQNWVEAAGLSLRHDHGSQYLSDDFQNDIKFLGIASSPAFVRQPEGNGCAERFIRTLKENLLWVRTFQTVEELRKALLEFREIYNHQWIMKRLGYRTPAQARQEACVAVEIAA